MVGDYGITASEYWGMSPAEIGLILDAKRPKTVGGLHEDDRDGLEQRRLQLESEGYVVA